MEIKIAQMEQRLYQCEKDTAATLRKVEALSDVYLALTRVADKVERVEEDVCEMRDDLKQIKNAPLKRLNGAMDTVLKVTIGALVSYALMRVGLGG